MATKTKRYFAVGGYYDSLTLSEARKSALTGAKQDDDVYFVVEVVEIATKLDTVELRAVKDSDLANA